MLCGWMFFRVASRTKLGFTARRNVTGSISCDVRGAMALKRGEQRPQEKNHEIHGIGAELRYAYIYSKIGL